MGRRLVVLLLAVLALVGGLPAHATTPTTAHFLTAAEATTETASGVAEASGSSAGKAFNPAEVAGESDPKTVVAAAIRRADDLGDVVNQTVAAVRVPNEPGFPGIGPVDDPGGLVTGALAIAAIIAKLTGRL